jgi:hypothetical protein
MDPEAFCDLALQTADKGTDNGQTETTINPVLAVLFRKQRLVI